MYQLVLSLIPVVEFNSKYRFVQCLDTVAVLVNDIFVSTIEEKSSFTLGLKDY